MPRVGNKERGPILRPLNTAEVVIYCTNRVLRREVGAAAINTCISVIQVLLSALKTSPPHFDRELGTDVDGERHLKSHENKCFLNKNFERYVRQYLKH